MDQSIQALRLSGKDKEGYQRGVDLIVGCLQLVQLVQLEAQKLRDCAVLLIKITMLEEKNRMQMQRPTDIHQ